MIHTRICDLLGIVHPIVLGGMGTATTAPLVAAVSNAAQLETEIASICERTEKRRLMSLLLFCLSLGIFLLLSI